VLRFETASEAETIALGEKLARQVFPAHGVVLLTGGLGAGKTTLVKGIVRERAPSFREEVSSPTYTLIHEYGDPVTVYHVDLYRLDHERELATLGLEELLDRGALLVVEWPEKFPRIWPVRRVDVRIERGPGDQRSVTVLESQAL